MIQWQVLCGDVRERLAELPANSVQCCVTSPPYFGLRDYGNAGQLGLEPTPDLYVAALVDVFRGIRRVLSDDSTTWLNLGDSYAGSWGARGRGPGTKAPRPDLEAKYGTAALNRRTWRASDTTGGLDGGRLTKTQQNRNGLMAVEGCKSKDLIGIPWRVAFALQADGWYLRSDIIWSKPNPMPESVTDRPTKAHEYIFLLSKSARYFYDADAIREPNTVGTIERLASGPVQAKALGPKNQLGRRDGNVRPYTGQATKDYDAAGAQNPSDTKRRILDAMADPEYLGRNKRSVWHVATQPYPDAHFATYPEALIEPCILAGSKPGDTILDPFCGSGTTGAVAVRHQRNFLGIELNPAYVELSRKRIGAVAPLFASERTA